MGLQDVGVKAVIENLSQYLSGGAQMDKTNASLGKSAESAAAAVDKMDKALVDAGKAASSAGAALDKIDKAAAEVGKSTQDAAGHSKRLADETASASARTAVNLSTIKLAALAMSGAFTIAVGSAIKASIDYESAFAGVAKTVNATKPQLDALSKGFLDLSQTIPTSAVELAHIGEAAGQLGIHQENILSFTKVIADLGKTTNLSTEEAATSLARLANVMQTPQTEFDRLGSTIVALGNNFATTETEIVAMGLRLSGAGKQVGLTESQVLALGAALSSVGIEAEAGGTAFSKVLVDMSSAVQSNAKELTLFAAVSGETVAQFKEKFQKDAAGALLDFVKGLDKATKEGANTFAILEALGFSEVRVRDALLRASSASDTFTSAVKVGNDAWRDNTALTKEAETRYKTTESQLDILGNKVFAVRKEMGDKMTPAVQELGRALNLLVDDITPAATGLAVNLGDALNSASLLMQILERDTRAVIDSLYDLTVNLQGIDSGALRRAQAGMSATGPLTQTQPFMQGWDINDIIAYNVAATQVNTLTSEGAVAMKKWQAEADRAAEAAKRNAAHLNALANSFGGTKKGAQEAKTAMQEFGIGLDDIRHAGEAAKLSQEAIDAAILKMGGTILDTGPIVEGFGKTTVRLAAAFDAAGLNGQALVAQLIALNEADKAKKEADKAKQESDRLNAASAGRLQKAMEDAKFSIEEQRAVLGPLGVDLIDVGEKAGDTGQTFARLSLDFQRAGLSADAADAAVKRLIASAEAAKVSQATLTGISGVATRDTLGSVRSREPKDAASAAAEFAQAATGLSQLKAAGESLDVALDVMNNRLGALGTRFAELSGEDKAAAGVLMDKLTKLREEFRAGHLTLEDYQKGVQDSTAELGRLAGKIDDADRAINKLNEDAAARMAQDALATAADKASSALQVQRDLINAGLGPAWTRLGDTMAQAMKKFEESVDAARRKVDELLAVQGIIIGRQNQDIDSGQRAREAAAKFAEAVKAGMSREDIAAALQQALAGAGRMDDIFQLVFYGAIQETLLRAGIAIAPRIGQGISSAIMEALGVRSVIEAMGGDMQSGMSASQAAAAFIEQQNEQGNSFDRGGIVPGPLGAPRMILAHGGETVIPRRPDLMMLPPSMTGAARYDRSVTYNLTANYTNPQEPQALRYELQTLAMLAAR